MPCSTNAELPLPMRRHLPAHAQDISRAAFNHSLAAHAGGREREEAAHRIAWTAVKRRFVKQSGDWIPIDPDV